jgi:GTP-binding protein
LEAIEAIAGTAGLSSAGEAGSTRAAIRDRDANARQAPHPAAGRGPCDPMPMSNPLARAKYLMAAHNPQQLPADGGYEVAFAGRSNAGKSTALNAICQQNALARVSKTPGRTQQLVFFDIPPTTDRFQAFLDRYFAERQALKGLVVVMDIRHPLKEYDRQMLGYAVSRGLPAHAILTKADKLGRGAQGNALLAVRKDMQAEYGEGVSVQLFSGESKIGVDEARRTIRGWLDLY